MPVIVMCSTKGGVGKSTTALVLAQVFAEAGSSVTLIDADPNQPLMTWVARTKGGSADNLKVIGNVDENSIIETIDNSANETAFVIVDLEGSANLTASYALGRADLVLIPMRGKQLDADQAGRVVSLIQRETRTYRRTIPYRVIFTMTSALESKEQRSLRSSIEEHGIQILPAAMADRAAFSAIFQIGGTIYELTKDDVSNAKAAIENAGLVASAVIESLKNEELAQ